MLGASFAAVAPAVPSWNSAFGNGGNVGGLISAILAPTGGFGKFLVVLVALSVPSACAPTMYTFGLSFTSFKPSTIDPVLQVQVSCQSLQFSLKCLDISSQSFQKPCLSRFLYEVVKPADLVSKLDSYCDHWGDTVLCNTR